MEKREEYKGKLRRGCMKYWLWGCNRCHRRTKCTIVEGGSEV